MTLEEYVDAHGGVAKAKNKFGVSHASLAYWVNNGIPRKRIEGVAEQIGMPFDDVITWVSLDRRNRPNVRKCLRCEKDFKSDGIHNRICTSCKIVNSSVLSEYNVHINVKD